MNFGRRLQGWWYALHYWGGLFFFIVGIALLQLLAVFGFLLPVGPRWQRFTQRLVRTYLRSYLAYLHATRALDIGFEGWQEAFAKQPGIIVSNHPSMLDAPFFLSRLPQGICIFKVALARSILRGKAASIAGYIHSEEGVDGLRTAIEAVKAGAQFVFFPEGTRTPAKGTITLHPLYAVVAKYARVPVHLFVIERNSNALTKAHPLRAVPILPARFRVRYVRSIQSDAYPTAAKLHGAVEAILRPQIEARRVPTHPRLYAWRTVVETSAERVEWKLRIPDGPGYFSGHFPGHPIAPGALSVHWMLEAWKAGPGAGGARPEMNAIRCLREIGPGEEVQLVLQRKGPSWRAELKVNETLAAKATITSAQVS